MGNKIKNMSESSFLKLFFGFIAACFLIAAAAMPDRGRMFTGLWEIISSPCKISTNFFALGGYAATFLNMGLVALILLGIFVLTRATVNNVSTLAFLLTVGFCSWGIHVLNMWPTILGVLLYGAVKKEKPAGLANAMLFSTGIAPLISELLLRYPNPDTVGFSLAGAAMALAVGLFIGFFLPAGLANSPKVHHGFDLYSAAVPVGMTAFLLQAVLYKTFGVALPAVDGAQLQVASRLTVNVFCGAVFGLCVILALVLGCKPRDYWGLLAAKDRVESVSAKLGNGVFLMNVGVYGLFILGYYNLIGAEFNGVTMGVIFCMLACCNSGSHPGNVWPIMVGYLLGSWVCGWAAARVGGSFASAVNAQAIVVGLCYANGLSPICDKYGWPLGILAGMMHYGMVTTVPQLHGGFCLYNGGFTAALVCLLLVPQLQRFLPTRQERLAARTR